MDHGGMNKHPSTQGAMQLKSLTVSLLLAFAGQGLHAQSASPSASRFVEDGSCGGDVIRWLWDSVTGPVTKNWTGIVPLKRHTVLVPEAERGGAEAKRIMMFGDMVGMWADTPPVVHADVRAIYGRADLVIGNIEAPITTYRPGLLGVKDGLNPSGSQFFNFHIPRQYLRSITAQYCIDPKKTVLSVANNHANDRGDWSQTVEAMSALNASDGFRFTGVDADPSHDPQIEVFDSGALRVGVVGWTHKNNAPPKMAADGSIVRPTWQPSRKVSYEWNEATGDVDTSRRRDFTERRRALGLDLLIGVPHWGCEFQSYPKPYQVQETSLFAKSGFDVIAGAHPGVMQPAALIDGDPAKLVFYSMGVMNKTFNFLNKPALITAVELMVDANGRLLEYTVHPFIQRYHRKASNLPASVDCGSRTPSDIPRPTREEVVTLEQAYRDATPDGEWKTSDIDMAVRAFRQVFPD
jgi:hypothetical protein